MANPKPKRRPELDALRGLFLVWMTITHLPTHLSDFVNQPFGFVSSAEGFVFLSALLVSRIYARQSLEDETGLRTKLWKRAAKIYGIHLLMLALAFTVAAGLAVTTHKAAIYNLLNFYIAHPVPAIVGSILLVYCPPLLDILPMYVLFLAATPLVLSFSNRFGWRRTVALSGLLWLGGQLGLRQLTHDATIRITHLQIPLQETGAFNLFAWQAVWLVGLWLGAKSAQAGEFPLKRLPRWTAAAALAVCIFFLCVRHGWMGPHLTAETLAPLLDKWNIGPLRVLNLVAFTVLAYWLRRFIVPIIAVEPFLTLGKASLQVFCAHLIFVFIGLALLYSDVSELHGFVAFGLLALTFSALILLAAWQVKRNGIDKGAPRSEEKADGRAATPSSVQLSTSAAGPLPIAPAAEVSASAGD